MKALQLVMLLKEIQKTTSTLMFTIRATTWSRLLMSRDSLALIHRTEVATSFISAKEWTTRVNGRATEDIMNSSNSAKFLS